MENDREQLQTKFSRAEEASMAKEKVCATKFVEDSKIHIT